jgi:hypothetical protein
MTNDLILKHPLIDRGDDTKVEHTPTPWEAFDYGYHMRPYSQTSWVSRTGDNDRKLVCGCWEAALPLMKKQAAWDWEPIIKQTEAAIAKARGGAGSGGAR